MAARLNWMPASLYNSSVSIIAARFHQMKRDIVSLPNNLLFDIFYKLFLQNDLVQLFGDMAKLDIFLRLLECKDNKIRLHHCFQGLMDQAFPLAKSLADAFRQKCCVTQHKPSPEQRRAILSGLSLGSFLAEAGWYDESEVTFNASLQLAHLRVHVDEDVNGNGEVDDSQYVAMSAECCVRLMAVLNANCKYADCRLASEKAVFYFDLLDARIASSSSSSSPASSSQLPVNRGGLLAELCSLCFAQSQYDDAYLSAEASLEQLKDYLPPKTIVDVLRHAAKACVVKREFDKAELLVRGAVNLAWEEFGKEHPKFADALTDYGFYLLNVDSIAQAVVVYTLALNCRKNCFKGSNINVAISHEDLAYSTYVLEYSSGEFQRARNHAERAITIITHILPDDHLLLASSKRVKALILEEIAIDSRDKATQKKLLEEAEDLHRHSLSLALKAFGENNVQTAKHYGNLGRLYQSKGQYGEAERMHLKAIEIKERLLGPEDYEVALSVGHLASLYNYDMEMYEEAEKLYFRSIKIGKKLFGDGYSGLEYDYRGLLKLYNSMRNYQGALEYHAKLHDWSELRDELTNGGSELGRQNQLADRLGSDSGQPVCAETIDLESLKTEFFASPSRFPTH